MRIAVVGNGLIGHGIAELFAVAGHEVALIGRSSESLASAREKIGRSIAALVAEGVLPPLDVDEALRRVTVGTELSAASGAEFVVEALPEDMPLKHATFLALEEVCSTGAVLASASGHPASRLDPGLAHPERLIATHFWYPPQLLPLVEVCGSPRTSPETVERTCGILRGIGKEPVVIDREIEGFIGNRIQFAALREAWSLWASGAASAEAIDAVVKHSIGRRYSVTGPIESGDLAGLGTMAAFAASLWPDLSTDAAPPRQVVERAARRAGTVHDRSAEEWDRLLADRRAELVRWMLSDRDRRAAQEAERRD